MMEESNKKETHEEGRIYSRNIMGNMLSTMSNKMKTNNLQEFKKYIETENSTIKDNANAIQYSYNLNLNLYNPDTSNGIIQVNPSTVMDTIGFGQSEEEAENMSAFSFSSMSSTDVWQEMMDNRDLIKSQYDIVAGRLPENYNEVVVLVDENREISDYTLYALGLYNQSDLKEMMNNIKSGKGFDKKEVTSYSYDEILNLEYKLLLNTDFYQKSNGVWVDKSKDATYMKNKIDSAETIKVVGIIKPNEEAVISDTSGIIMYTKDLTEYVINKINEAEIVKEQKSNPNINVLTGTAFLDETQLYTMNSQYSSISPEQMAGLQNLSQEELMSLMTSYASNMDATYKSVMKKLGSVDLDKPSAINIYPKNFDSKETISNAIEEYNQTQRNNGKEENVIEYSDLVGMMMSSVSTIVNIISYVLIAFVSISLIVSSIMIGIITYISVLERTKEIGILRAIGASKKDISRVFNAETLIVGLAAGILGIGVTILLNIPINFIIKKIVNVSGIAALPVGGGIALVIISVILTVIAGLIPSKMASKKDPVVALRTE
jgi:putative ABC transport system permease protein